MSDLPDTSLLTEDEQLQKTLAAFDKFPKLHMWSSLFISGPKDVKGNRTACALIAYSLDREDPKQYAVAMTMGSQNFRKLKDVAAEYLNAQGMGVGQQLDLLAAKAVNSNNATYLKMLMEITEAYIPKPSIAVQNNTQNNFNNIQVTPEEEAAFDKEFADFITAKYSPPPVVAASPIPTLTPDASQQTGS